MRRPLTGVRALVLGAHTSALQFGVARFPAPGDYLVARHFRHAADGGKGSNQALAAARLGAHVTLLSAVGDDAAGHAALSSMRQQGVDVSRVLVSTRLPTGLGAGFCLDDGTVMGATYLGATAEVTRDYVQRQRDAFADGYDVLLASLEVPVEAVATALTLAASIPHVILNPAPADDLPRRPLPAVRVLTPNEPEARLLAGLAPDGSEAIADVAQRVAETFRVPNIAITLGSEGCYLVSGGTSEALPCPSVRAVDTSGAGDCFNAALSLTLGAGWALPEAARFAMQAASYSVTRVDSWPAFPTLDEVLRFGGQVE
jgi:ribokinase